MHNLNLTTKHTKESKEHLLQVRDGLYRLLYYVFLIAVHIFYIQVYTTAHIKYDFQLGRVNQM